LFVANRYVECWYRGYAPTLTSAVLGAIYHLMARGNGRQDIVCDDVDRQRLQEQLGKAASRCSWRVCAFAIMSNHLHVVLKTPEPNLSRGMQSFLSGYANAWSRRHGFSGHFFQECRDRMQRHRMQGQETQNAGTGNANLTHDGQLTNLGGLGG
jgi:REP element-mobilizing transposase RayT